MRLALALSLVALSALPAAAQESRAGEVTIYEFLDGDLVEGGRYSPDGTDVRVLRRGARRSLIRPRVQFVPELLKSVERL